MLKRVLKWADKHLEETIIFPFLFAILILLVIEVPKRYFFGKASPYVDEIARVMFIWVVFIGMPYAYKAKKHILIDLLPEELPLKFNLFVELFSHTISLIFCAVMGYVAVLTINFLYEVGINSIALEIPKGTFMLCIAIGFFGTVIRAIQSIIISIREYREGKSHTRTISE